MADLATAYLTLVPSLRGAQEQIEKQLSGVKLDKSGIKLGDSLGDSMSSSLLGKFGNGLLKAGSLITSTLVKPVVAGVGTIGAAVTGVAAAGGISRALKLEQAQFMLKGLGYEGENLQKVMDIATASVKGTAFGLDSAATAASLLAASGVDIGTQMEPALRSVTGLAAMTGNSMEEIADIFSEVAAQGKVSGDTLNRLSARGINATTVLGEALGKTSAEIKDMVSKGQVDFDTFARVMNEKFGDAAYGANETFSGAMANVRAALSRVGQAFAEPALQNLTKIFAAMIPAIDAVNTAMKPLANMFGAWATVISSQVITAINNFTENIKNGMSVAEAFGRLFQDMAPAVESSTRAMAQAVKNGIPAIFEIIVSMAGPLMDAAVQMFAGFSEAFMNTMVNMQPMIADAIHGIEGWLIENGPTILFAALELFVGLGVALNTIIETVVHDLVDFLGQMCSDIASSAGDMLNAAGEFFGQLVTSLFMVVAEVTYNIASAIGRFVNAVATGYGMMLSGAMTFFGGIVSAIGSTVGSAVSAIGSLISSVVSSVSGAAGRMASAASSMVQGMVQGIFNGAGAVVSAIQRVCSNALDAVRSFFGIASPSKVMRKMFGYVGDGMALGLADSEYKVDQAMDSLLDSTYGKAASFDVGIRSQLDQGPARSQNEEVVEAIRALHDDLYSIIKSANPDGITERQFGRLVRQYA